jgi:Zn-dependent protease
VSWSWRWSVPLGSIAGIRIRLHLSFLLLVLFVVAAGGAQTLPAVLAELAWLGAVFGGVLVHELSHSIVARHYGVVVRDILLLPIGGLSEMEMPRDARQELAISGAGPCRSSGPRRGG